MLLRRAWRGIRRIRTDDVNGDSGNAKRPRLNPRRTFDLPPQSLNSHHQGHNKEPPQTYIKATQHRWRYIPVVLQFVLIASFLHYRKHGRA